MRELCGIKNYYNYRKTKINYIGKDNDEGVEEAKVKEEVGKKI